MVTRPLLYLLFAVLVGTGAYWVVVVSVGGLRDNPFRRFVVPEAWPVPPGAAAHPFWARFPALRSANPDERHAAWQELLAFDRADLPHPAARPAAWPLEERIFAHALLWRLWRGKSFRAGGLGLRLDREENAPPLRVGEPARLRLSIVSIAGTGRVRFPRGLPALLEAGAELHGFTRPPGRLPEITPSPPESGARPAPDPPVAVRRRVILRAPDVASWRLRQPGRYAVRMVLDLTRAEIQDSRVPRGLWITNPLVLDVAPAK